MADGQEGNLPFTVPKLCIKRVPVQERPPRKQKMPRSSDTTQSSSSGGLKLVLRVPKDAEASRCDSTAETSEESVEATLQCDKSRDGKDAEPETASQCDDANSVDAAVQSEDGDQSSPAPSSCGANAGKRRRKKRRFRLTTPAQKTKSKLWKENTDSVGKESQSPQRSKRSDQKKNEENSADESAVTVDAPASVDAETSSTDRQDTFPSPPADVVSSFTPLQCLLDHLLRGFLKKDPERYFAYPVTDDIAPNYSAIVSHPMDFLTIRKKIDANDYKNVQEFKADINLICSNAMTYNQKNTVYHVAAKKLQNVAEYMFSKEKLGAARRMMPQLTKLTGKDLGCTWAELEGRAKAKKAKLGHYSCIVDNMCPEEILEQVQSAAAAAREKLNESHPSVQVLFSGEPEGKELITLKMLLPEHVWDPDIEESIEGKEKGGSKSRPRLLGDLISKLKEGNPGVLMPDYTKDKVVPVTYLDNGPFSSFVPHYDSTWATLGKEESDMLLSTFGGDEHCVRYVDSICSFVRDTNSDALSDMVKSFIEDLTDAIAQADVPEDVQNGDDIDAASAGDDAELNPTQELLDKNAVLIEELHTLQNERLSTQPPFVLTHAPGPSAVEVSAAATVVCNLQQLATQATPAQLIMTECVQGIMSGEGGNAQDSNEEYDINVLREFFMVDDDA